MNKIIVAGSRGFNDHNLLKNKLNYYLSNLTDIEIVSGGAKGADRLGEQYAELRGYPVKVFKADWDNLGKRAGMVRNKEMSSYANYLVAFWDGKSVGTKHMIDSATKAGLKVRVVRY